MRTAPHSRGLTPPVADAPPLRRRAALVAIAAPALAHAATGQPPGAQRLPWPAGQATPSLELPQVDGPIWRLAQAAGHGVLLNFWASWCEPCRAELPSLQRLAQRFEPAGLRVLAVNYKEHERTVLRFLEAQPLELPVLRDADGEAAKAWGVRIFPTTVAVGRDGRAVFSVRGEVDWESPRAMAWIRPLLRPRPA